MKRTLGEWRTVQLSWIYVESIFSSPDMKRNLAEVNQVFIKVHRNWLDLMRAVNDKPLALPVAGLQLGTLEQLKAMARDLDEVQKSVDGYLEDKRQTFPRFYFLSDDELLAILSETRNPDKVQPHLRKCFDNIDRLVFGENHKVSAIVSLEGEEVELKREVTPREGVDIWLGLVEAEVEATLKHRLIGALATYSAKKRTSWIFNHPAQLVLAVAQVSAA